MKQNLAAGEVAPPPEVPDTKNVRGGKTVPPTRRAPSRRTERSIQVTSPTSLLEIVPPLLGFQPSNSMVVIGTEPPRAHVKLTLRFDLPDPPDPDLAAEIAQHALSVLSAQRIQTAVGVGYGPGPLVTPVADALRELAARDGVRITELLRVADQRYWSYVCSDPGCCPPEGTPFEVADHAAVLTPPAGAARVLASRAELAATVAAAEGEQAELMQAATRRAEEHATRLVGRVMRSGRTPSVRRLIVNAGLAAVREAVACYRRGDQLAAGSAAAWLTLVLRDLRVRDDAWARMDPKHREAHLRLWTDLTRLARPGYVPAPASLLAFVAWQSGNGALANVALDRALADNPHYTMAQLLRQAIDSGAPPSMARLPMTPEEVAASYDELEDEVDEADEAEADEVEEDHEDDEEKEEEEYEDEDEEEEDEEEYEEEDEEEYEDEADEVDEVDEADEVDEEPAEAEETTETECGTAAEDG